jgi:toxin ParE1/3/4
MRIFTSQKAEADLLRIYRYLEERNPTAALNVLEEIHRKLEQIARFPFIGPERSRLAPGLRASVVGKHLIFYVIGVDRITVVRVIDGRMDVDEEFWR